MVTNKDIEKYKHLVYKIVNEYRNGTFKHHTFIDWNEMEQVGMIALYKALKNYDEKTTVPFINYASTAIWRAIYRQHLFDSKTRDNKELETVFNIADEKTIDMDNHIDNIELLTKIDKIAKRLSIKKKTKEILLMAMSGMRTQDIADKMGVSIQYVRMVFRKYTRQIIDKLNGGNNVDRK